MQSFFSLFQAWLFNTSLAVYMYFAIKLISIKKKRVQCIPIKASDFHTEKVIHVPDITVTSSEQGLKVVHTHMWMFDVYHVILKHCYFLIGMK